MFGNAIVGWVLEKSPKIVTSWALEISGISRLHLVSLPPQKSGSNPSSKIDIFIVIVGQEIPIGFCESRVLELSQLIPPLKLIDRLLK
jgi:hypothetical protein